MSFGWEQVSRESDEYKVCLAAVTGIGTVAGIVVGAVGAAPTVGTSMAALPLAGTAMGFAAGFVACPYLAPKVKKKLLDGAELTSAEVDEASKAMSSYATSGSPDNAVKLIASIRAVIPTLPKGALACKDVVSTGNRLLYGV